MTTPINWILCGNRYACSQRLNEESLQNATSSVSEAEAYTGRIGVGGLLNSEKISLIAGKAMRSEGLLKCDFSGA